jgi:SRSO17 transposase
MVKRYTINSEFVFEDCLVTPSVYEGVLQRFDEFITPFIAHLHARSHQQKARDYMRGLLSDTERKNIESISYFHGYDRQRLQIFIGQTDWNDEIILNKLATQIADEIGEEDGILILDPTSFPKKGNESVGVQRQWCGRLGKTENCQVATFLAYASRVEFALVDRRLYLPDVWIEDQSRCDKAGIPKQHQVKKTRHQQALEMIDGRGKKLPHKWIAGDDEMGKVPWFRRKLRAQNESYLFAVPSNILIYDIDALGEYDETRAKELQRMFVNVYKKEKNIPSKKWKTIKVRQGHKGWLTVKLATCRVRAKIENEVGDEEILIVSKWREDNGKPRCDYYLSWSDEATDLHEYARVIKQAYRIEESFHRAKGECGLADYQVRNWLGWHHHVALSLLTLWFLTVELMNQKKTYR